MKCKRMVATVICIVLLCILVFPLPVPAAEGVVLSKTKDAGQGIVQLTSEKGQPKVVSVVFDNSSSMVRKDKKKNEQLDEKKRYTTRWIEADYTVKALAAMMDLDDILRLYIMSGYRSDVKTAAMARPGEIKIGKEKQEAVNEVQEYFDKMKFCNYTYYQGVIEAARDMRPYLKEGKDCWIVILTDGFFWEKGQSAMDAETLSKNLHEITAPNAYGEGSIKVAYIPIGDMGDTAEIQEDIARGIYVADVADGGSGGQESLILKKVTDCINRIYGRVRLEHAIEEEYLPAEGKDIRFHFDIPLERLIVFMQHSGSEELYDTYRKRRESLENSGKTGMEIEIGSPLVPVLLARSDEANFSARELFPEYEDGTPPYDSKNVKYKELWGKMLSYTKKSPSRSGSEEGELLIPVNSDNRPDVEIYYQPAIKVGLEYIQNGESVQHIEGCLSSATGEAHEEYCLQEGEVTVRIKLLDDYGRELTNVDSGLLYKDKFCVCLKPVDGDEWQLMESTGMDYEFRTYLEQKDYQIKVITPWDEQKTGVLKVQERRKELEILPLETKEIILNESEDGAGLLEIEVLEDGIIPPEDTILKMSVECACDDEQLTIVPVESTEQGIWLFRPVLYDPRNHEAPKEVQIHISVSRPYAVGEPETAEMEVSLPVSSYPEELAVGLESDDVIEVGSLLWPLGMQDIPVNYKCRDVLGEEEKSRVSNRDFQVEPEDIASYILMGEDGDIHIRKSWKWFFMNEESAEVTFHSSYNLWNTQNEVDVVLTLKFHIIPVWVKYLAAGILLLIILWFLAIRIRNHTYRFIPRLQARLEAQTKKKIFQYKLKQDRRRHRIDPSCNYCFLCYENGEHVEEPFIPDLRIRIRKNRFGGGYEIINYSDFADADRFMIGGKAINEKNRIFDKVNLFSLKDKIGVTFYLEIS